MSFCFFNLYHHGFVRVAIAIPEVRVANPHFHAQEIIEMMKQAHQDRAILVLFPELTLSSYTCEDLFHQQLLLEECERALQSVLSATELLPVIGVVGLPVRRQHLLFNCAAVFAQGKLLGIVPKTYLPNYREFYESRQFSSADTIPTGTLDICGQKNIPFGSDLIFEHEQQSLFRFHVEICEDAWVPIPPSCYAALAGATVLLNLSASNITVGKAEYRHQLVANQSARCLAAYAYSAAGTGESTTDLAWDGHAMVYENGQLLAESERFLQQRQLILADIDLDRLSQERRRQNSFSHAVALHRERLSSFQTISLAVNLPQEETLPLRRVYERFPYVPSQMNLRNERCYESYEIQVQGLVKRLKAAQMQRVVLGISGGLDSTQALIVAARAFDLLGYSREQIRAYTMPGFATSTRTRQQALRLMEAIGCYAEEIDIRPSCLQMLKDIQHPYAQGYPVYDITFENVQAGERTSHLFRLANLHQALVLGTGDLSELALGWCTYGVGDHMSHYNVNASIPKTLIQYLIRWVAQQQWLGAEASLVLQDILETEISPELVPGDDQDKQPAQRTEDVIGPYELHDFFLYYTLRYGYTPARVAFLAHHAWNHREQGVWPDIPEARRHAYSLQDIKQHLRNFLWRFYQISQFKRSCVPNAPKVGSGGSLSPRGDYRAPSDSDATLWLESLHAIPTNDIDAV